MLYEYKGVEFECDMDIDESEAQNYIERAKAKFNLCPAKLTCHIDGDYVDIEYTWDRAPKFQRIRRITGYLVGTLDRFNDAKRAEESERVKHGV